MNTEWKSFGDRQRFAFEYCFQPDPDGGRAATRLESASWGDFRLWVNGRNLCQHHHRGEIRHEITWYLSPLLDWFAENWDPLFHEERFPLPCDKPNARMGYLDSLRRYMGDTDPIVEAKGEAWFSWWRRHALRAGRRGGRFPDLFFRRMVDFSEISWGNFPLEGVGDDFYFTIPQGHAHLPVALVAEPLLAGVADAVFRLKDERVEEETYTALASRIETIFSRGQLTNRLSWYTRIISSAGGAVQTTIRNIIHPEEETGFIRRLSPAVAMFGSMSPEISTADLESIIPFYIQAHRQGGEDLRLRALIPRDPAFPGTDPYHAGYDAALDFLDTIGKEGATDQRTDIDAICQNLGIRIESVALEESNIRGVAFAGESVMPTILINTVHSFNQQPEGRRFTIGHELCHILHDRFFGGEVSIVSGPWAPANIEKRANAFSAMLLMPLDSINGLIESMVFPLDTIDGLTFLSNRLGVGKRALLWHLYNLCKLDEGQRVRLAWEMGMVPMPEFH